MDAIRSLQEFDLSENEARVYVALLELGIVSSGEIQKKTKLHSQLIYTAIERLVDKKLVSFKTKRGIKYFQALSPIVFTEQLERKQEVLNDLIPELSKFASRSDDKLEASILYGEKDYFDNMEELVRSAARTDKIIRIIGGAKDTDAYSILGDKYEQYVALLQKARVKKYLISPEQFSDEFKKKFANEKGNILKTLEYGLSSPTYTRITQEMVTIEVYAKEVMVIRIKNTSIAQAYIEHFNLLWKQAKRYNKKT